MFTARLSYPTTSQYGVITATLNSPSLFGQWLSTHTCCNKAAGILKFLPQRRTSSPPTNSALVRDLIAIGTGLIEARHHHLANTAVVQGFKEFCFCPYLRFSDMHAWYLYNYCLKIHGTPLTVWYLTLIYFLIYSHFKMPKGFQRLSGALFILILSVPDRNVNNLSKRVCDPQWLLSHCEMFGEWRLKCQPRSGIGMFSWWRKKSTSMSVSHPSSCAVTSKGWAWSFLTREIQNIKYFTWLDMLNLHSSHQMASLMLHFNNKSEKHK